ncbi:MAG: phage tail tape measure protein [Alphaproteobacteria bacterium]|nr:phage tail tape measure protein [Alphaproteobacteria bacterium]
MNVFELFGKISLDSSGFIKGLNSIKSVAGNVAKMAAAAIGTATTAITAFGASAVRTGMNFDSAMSQVAATMGKSVDEIQDLRDFAKEMGAKTAFSASQAAEALNFMALAGYDAKKSMQMLPNVLNLAAAGGMELARASDMITDTQSALSLTMEETTDLVDQMAKTASKTNTSVSQLGDAMLTVGGTAKTMKGGTVELAAALGILADNGTKGAEGGTALRNVLMTMSSAKFEKTFGALGVSAYDSEGKMRELKDVLADMNAVMSNMTDKEKTQLISKTFNKFDLKNVNALLATSTERWDKLTTEISEASGASEAMAETQLDNLTGNVTKLKSAYEGVQIEISDKLTPTLNDFVKLGTEGLSDITSGLKSNGLQGATTAFGNFLSKGLQTITEKIPDLVKAGSNVLTAVIKGMSDNVSVVVDAAVEIIPILIEGIGQALPALTSGFFERIVGIANGIVRLTPELLPQIISIVSNIANLIVNNADTIANATIAIIGVVADALIDNLPILIEAALLIIDKLLNYIIDPKNLAKIVEMAAKVILSVSAALLAAAPKLLIGVGKIIGTVFDKIVNTDWTEVGQKLIENITTSLKMASNKLTVWWNGWSQEIGKYAVIGWNGVVETWSGVGRWFGDRWNDIKNVFGNVADWFRNIFSTAWENIKNVFSPVGDMFNSIGNSILNGLKSIVNALIKGINDVISIPFSGLNDALDGIKKIDILGGRPFDWINLVPIPQIPYLAQGGVLKRGQMAFLEGQGDEAVIPLSQNTEWINKIADELNKKSGGNATYNFIFNVENVNGDKESIEQNAELLMETFTDIMARKGVVFA